MTTNRGTELDGTAGRDDELDDRIRILIIDDSPTYLRFASSALAEARYRVETSSSVWISALVSQLRPHLVLMDVNLGSIAGNQIVEALRDRCFTRQTRFLLYSTLEPAELERLAKECGADGYIHKNGDPVLLREKVRLALSRPPRARAEETASKLAPRPVTLQWAPV